VILIVLLSGAAMGQDSTMQAKMDSLLYYQKKVLELQQQVYSEVAQYKEPLEGKNYGIEFNPAFLLYGLSAGSKSCIIVSAGFSLFNVNRGAEVAFPIFIQSGELGDGSGYSSLFLYNQDAIYRKFLGRHQDGFFIEGGLRYTHISEDFPNYYYPGGSYYYYDVRTETRSSDRVGMMFGIGYRYFSYSGIYWGMSLKCGTYFSPKSVGYNGVMLFGEKTILDIELLKFGVAF
jgi:hypothetical protein